MMQIYEATLYIFIHSKLYYGRCTRAQHFGCYKRSQVRGISHGHFPAESKSNQQKRRKYKMKGVVLAITIFGALFSLGYGKCANRNVPYMSNTGQTWYVNIYIQDCKWIFHAPKMHAFCDSYLWFILCLITSHTPGLYFRSWCCTFMCHSSIWRLQLFLLWNSYLPWWYKQ